jgi:hypothetical protein
MLNELWSLTNRHSGCDTLSGFLFGITEKRL